MRNGPISRALPAPLPGEKPRGRSRAELRAALTDLPRISLRESPGAAATGSGTAPTPPISRRVGSGRSTWNNELAFLQGEGRMDREWLELHLLPSLHHLLMQELPARCGGNGDTKKCHQPVRQGQHSYGDVAVPSLHCWMAPRPPNPRNPKFLQVQEAQRPRGQQECGTPGLLLQLGTRFGPWQCPGGLRGASLSFQDGSNC